MQTELIEPQNIQRAAALIKSGKPVAFPTETVYGLGAGVFHEEAIKTIYAVKGRPIDNPLIVHISSLQEAARIAIEIPDSFYLLAKYFFPGPLTLILKRHPDVPAVVSAGLHTIALRMPSHPIAQALIQQVGEPIAAPSANLSGRPSATTALHVLEDFEGKIAGVIDGGECPLGLESTVLSLLDEKCPELLRPGDITKEELETVLKQKVFLRDKKTGDKEQPLSPGMKYRHYAPSTPMKLFASIETLLTYTRQSPQLKSLLLASECPPQLLGLYEYLPLSAKYLYAALRLADKKDYAEILVLCEKNMQGQMALMNRLLRAASVETLLG